MHLGLMGWIWKQWMALFGPRVTSPLDLGGLFIFYVHMVYIHTM